MSLSPRFRRPKDKLLQTRERASLRDHVLGVLITLGYALAFILVAALLAFLASLISAPKAEAATAEAATAEGNSADSARIMGSKELIENAVKLDGIIVSFEGEAIGEALERGKMAWVNVSDGDNAIGIWMKGEDARRIRDFGDYRHKGDVVRVVGRFNRADPKQGGDLDIVASSVEVVSRGVAVEHPVARERIFFAGGSAALLVVAVLMYMRRSQGSKE